MVATWPKANRPIYGAAASAADADRFGEAAFIRIMEQATSEPSTELRRQAVAHIIVATTSHAVRNAAALALVDLDGRT